MYSVSHFNGYLISGKCGFFSYNAAIRGIVFSNDEMSLNGKKEKGVRPI